MKTTDVENPFGLIYCNLIQALAWIHMEKKSIPVEQALKEVKTEIQRRFVPSDLAVIITLPMRKYDALKRKALSNELTEHLKEQIGGPNWFDAIETDLMSALHEGVLNCFGINDNAGTHQEISPTDLIDLKFYYGIPIIEAGPRDLFLHNASCWSDLLFKKKEIAATQPYKDQNQPKLNLENNADFPNGTKWEDMTWILLSNELVRVEANGVSHKYLYSDIGFTDKRVGDVPDTRWTILRLFALHNGEIDWTSRLDTGARKRMSAAVRDIRKRLKYSFNINDDPFHPYRSSKSYKTKFSIKDNRTIDNTDHSEPEGFSEEEVIEYLNNTH